MFLGGHTDRDPVKLFRRCGSEEALFLPREVVPKPSKQKRTFHRRVRHAFVARRMVARFNCAI